MERILGLLQSKELASAWRKWKSMTLDYFHSSLVMRKTTLIWLGYWKRRACSTLHTLRLFSSQKGLEHRSRERSLLETALRVMTRYASWRRLGEALRCWCNRTAAFRCIVGTFKSMGTYQKRHALAVWTQFTRVQAKQCALRACIISRRQRQKSTGLKAWVRFARQQSAQENVLILVAHKLHRHRQRKALKEWQHRATSMSLLRTRVLIRNLISWKTICCRSRRGQERRRTLLRSFSGWKLHSKLLKVALKGKMWLRWKSSMRRRFDCASRIREHYSRVQSRKRSKDGTTLQRATLKWKAQASISRRTKQLVAVAASETTTLRRVFRCWETKLASKRFLRKIVSAVEPRNCTRFVATRFQLHCTELHSEVSRVFRRHSLEVKLAECAAGKALLTDALPDIRVLEGCTLEGAMHPS